MWTTTFYIGLMIERKPGALEFLSGGWEVRGGWGLADAVRLTSAAGATGPRKLDISYPTNEFTKLVKMWDKYDPDTMGVIVRYIKRCVPPVVVRFALSRKGLLIVSLCVVRRSRSTCEKERNPNRPRREASSAQSPARCDPTSPSSPALPPKGDLLTSLLPSPPISFLWPAHFLHSPLPNPQHRRTTPTLHSLRPPTPTQSLTARPRSSVLPRSSPKAPSRSRACRRSSNRLRTRRKRLWQRRRWRYRRRERWRLRETCVA